MPRVRFTNPTFFDGVSYAKDQVVNLKDAQISALGDSVEHADDVDVEAEAHDLMHDTTDPNVRQELNIKHEPGDVQDIPDALRDEQANVKAMEKAPANKMVKGARNK